MPYIAAVRPCSSQNDGSSTIRPSSDSKIVPGWACGLRARSRGVRTIAPTVRVTIVVGSAACPLPTTVEVLRCEEGEVDRVPDGDPPSLGPAAR